MNSQPLTGEEFDARTAEAPKRNLKRIVLMLIVPLILLAAGGYYWLASGTMVSTDNAAIKQDITSVGAQVSGPIAALIGAVPLAANPRGGRAIA